MANEQSAVSRVADREELPLLLDRARQFAGQYIDSLEERPAFPSEKSLRAMHALLECDVFYVAHPIRSTSAMRRVDGGIDKSHVQTY